MEKRRRIINSNSLVEHILALGLTGAKIYADEPLSKHCSFKIGGPADFYIEIPNEETLKIFLMKANDLEFKYMIIGSGTNILFSDSKFNGVVAKLTGDFEKFSIEGEKIICGAGANLPSVLKKAAENGLSGLECCAGIPGTVGGAVLGNAGSKDVWIGNVVESVEVFNKSGQKEFINKEKIDFQYRKSGLEEYVITKINFSLKKEAENDILKAVLENIKKRSQTQPLNYPNAGCIFKNPKGFSAGKLIEDAELKGKSSGGAKISEVHGNFIVNTGNAAAEDVLLLIKTAQSAVKDKFNIELELEIKTVNI